VGPTVGTGEGGEGVWIYAIARQVREVGVKIGCGVGQVVVSALGYWLAWVDGRGLGGGTADTPAYPYILHDASLLF